MSGFGAIWFATPADGLVRVADTPTPEEGIDITAFKPDGILGLNVNAVATEPGGGLLVASSDGLQRIGPDGRFETIVSGFNVRSVFRTSAGEIWAGTQGREVFRVRADGTVNTIQFNVTNNAAIHEDASGEIWIGSVNSGGLTVFDGSVFRVIGTHNSALPSNTIRDIELDGAGMLWFATPAGVARYDGEDFTTLTFADGLASTTTNTVFARGNGEIWVGHPSGSRGISVIDGGSITTMSVNGNRVTAITEDADGAVWIGHQFSGVSGQRADGSFERFDMNSSGLLNDVINRAISDPSGRRVLFATDQGIAVRELAGAPCPGDCDGSGAVDFNDLVAMLFEFDAPSAPASCDTDGDALVTFNDLVAALFLFGPCDGDGPAE